MACPFLKKIVNCFVLFNDFQQYLVLNSDITILNQNLSHSNYQC